MKTIPKMTSGFAKLLRASKALIAAAALASVAALVPPSAFAQKAAGQKTTSRKTTGKSGGKTVHINPDTIRRALLSGNTSVMTALNDVYMAKTSVNIARGNLLPSINVGAAIGGISGGPSFAVSSISFLLPFLLPSNWFALGAAENQLAATGFAYNLVELNEYASAWALYTTIINDYELRETYQRQYDNLKQIVDVVTAKVEIGQATQADLAQAMFNMHNAATTVSAVEETIKREHLAIIKLFNWPLSTKLVFDQLHPSPLKAESLKAQSILDRVFSASNEAKQVRSLIKASENVTWTKAFSFLGGASLNLPNTSGGVLPKSFSGLAAAGGVNLGFAYFPNIELSNYNTRQLQINYNEIYNLMGQVIATALASLEEAKEQLHNSRLAEMYAQKEFEGQFEAYRLGNIDLNRVLQAVTDINTAVAARIRATSDIDSQRVSLYRVMVIGPFERIPGCQLKGNESSSPMGLPVIGWITDLFSISGGQTTLTIDQLCRRTTSVR